MVDVLEDADSNTPHPLQCMFAFILPSYILPFASIDKLCLVLRSSSVSSLLIRQQIHIDLFSLLDRIH